MTDIASEEAQCYQTPNNTTKLNILKNLKLIFKLII